MKNRWFSFSAWPAVQNSTISLQAETAYSPSGCLVAVWTATVYSVRGLRNQWPLTVIGRGTALATSLVGTSWNTGWDSINAAPASTDVCQSPRLNVSHHVLELVGALVFLLVQVNKVMRDPILASALHVPADLEGVACDVADQDLLRNRQLVPVPDAAVRRLWLWKNKYVGFREQLWNTSTVTYIK